MAILKFCGARVHKTCVNGPIYIQVIGVHAEI